MLNLFGKNAFARKRKAKAMPVEMTSRIETLEDRMVLATGLVSTLFTSGSLYIYGSGAADTADLSIDSATANVVTLSNVNLSPGSAAGPFVVTGSIIIDMGNGADTVNFSGTTGVGVLSSGNLEVDLGSGADTLNIGGAASTGLNFTGDISVAGGNGGDTINVGAVAAVTVANLSIDTGTEATAAIAETVKLDQLTANGNVSVINGGTGLQQTQIGSVNAAANTVAGNLTIVQVNASNTGGYTATTNNTSVSGNLSISNGIGATNASTGAISTTISTTAAATIGGSTTLLNGSTTNGSGSVIVVQGGAANQAVFSGTVKLANSNAPANAITINGATMGTNAVNNRTTVSLTNGTSPVNDINLGVAGTPLANTFNGAVSATNNSNAAGANGVTISQGTFNRGLTVTNGITTGTAVAAATANTVTIAGAANVTVNNGTNVVITNGNATTTNNSVTIGNAGTGLAINGGGNLTVSNGTTTSGNESVVIQGNAVGVNNVTGNVSIVNRGTTGGTKTVTINGLTTSGRTGIAINNVGAGNSTNNIGGDSAAANTAVSITGSGGLVIQDGTGTSQTNVQNVTIGTLGATGQTGFRFIDNGGGADTLNLATFGALTVNSVTRISTGNGSDALTTGTGGTAVYNDSVFVSLGSGNDAVTIGASASSPAFSSANRFQFDGGSGVDTFSASALSLSDFENPLPRKLKSKITNFETLTVT